MLAAVKFMPEMHLWQHGFTWVAIGLFTKSRNEYQKKKETGYSR